MHETRAKYTRNSHKHHRSGNIVVYLALRIERAGGFNPAVLEEELNRFDDGSQEWRLPETEPNLNEPFLVQAEIIG